MAEIKRLFDLLDHLKEKFPKKRDVFARRQMEDWLHYTVDEYINNSTILAASFIASGLEKGDRVATVVGNRPEWNFLDMGIGMAGLVHVPVYPTISIVNFEKIFKDAGISMLIVERPSTLKRLEEVLPRITSLKKIVCLQEGSEAVHYHDLIKQGSYDEFLVLAEERAKTVDESDLASIIYTSGTTGNPKGVMLTHKNIVSNFIAISDVANLGKKHRALSFLPLCHVYERTLNYMYQHNGISIYYVEDLNNVGEYISEVRPHVFGAVPRVLEKVFDKILQRGHSLKRVKKRLFFKALDHGYKYGEDTSIKYRLKLFWYRFLVLRKWKKAFGGKLNFVVSGSASLQPRLAKAYWAAKIKLLEGYGLTETSPVVSVNTPKRRQRRIGTVGLPISSTEIKIADDGEILVKGPGIMKGYWNNEELSASVFENGWFKTGDIGEIIDGKFLKITDRKKELFKTSGGKYIAPQQIESHISESPYVDHIMVIGENRKFPSAIISPNFEYIEGWCKANNIIYTTPENALVNVDIIRKLYSEMDELNETLDKTEQIKQFLFVPHKWTQETGELSPTLKLRRKIILFKYRYQIEKLYAEPEGGVHFTKKAEK